MISEVLLPFWTGSRLSQDASVLFSCRFLYLCFTEVCVVGRSFFKCPVRALGQIEPEPIIDDLLCLEPIGDFGQIDRLLFQGSPQSLDEDVVQATSSAIR
jgi:hypothetical protein